MFNKFSLKDKVVVITGGAGLLGKMHAEAVIEAGGTAILTDIVDDGKCYYMDVTDKESIESFVSSLDRVDVLINNAALNPKMSTQDETLAGCFETPPSNSLSLPQQSFQTSFLTKSRRRTQQRT